MAAQAVDFTISGHVNRALFITNPSGGEDSTTEVKDNGSSGTRVRFVGSGESMVGLNVGVNLEFGVNEDAADQVTVRHSVVSLGGEFGKISIGHTGEAADGAVYRDKSGVFGIGHGQDKGAAGMDGGQYVVGGEGGRRDGIHFSSAGLGPASVHASYVTDYDDVTDRSSVKVNLDGDAGIAGYGASVAYMQWKDGAMDKSELAGALGLKLSSGITWSVAGASWGKDVDGSFVQSTLGYVFGNNAVAVSWYQSQDIGRPANDAAVTSFTGEGSAIGVGFKHTLPKANTEIIAAVQSYSSEADAVGADPGPVADAVDTSASVAVIGARVRF